MAPVSEGSLCKYLVNGTNFDVIRKTVVTKELGEGVLKTEEQRLIQRDGPGTPEEEV